MGVPSAAERERRAIALSGIVQGVGFRPFVYRLASQLGLAGFVRNRPSDVLVEIEGEASRVDEFLAQLVRAELPIRIDAIESQQISARGDAEFRIAESAGERTVPPTIAADIATCDECLREVLDPDDRRFGYALTTCTHCGPRLSFATGAPYDRPRTTMASFAMCAACAAEYADPGDRRFHAQSISCHACGPQLRLLDRDRRTVQTARSVDEAAAKIDAGSIVAIKGIGGYQLACDAENPSTVATLRERKSRDAKPFAVMVATLDEARALADLDESERALLMSPSRPIVLARRRGGISIAEGVAPGTDLLGVMLPSTAVHHLLLRAVGRPLVMTSANHGESPTLFADDAATMERLSQLADFVLTHDRPIEVRCDDSVARTVRNRVLPVRRARGYAPEPIAIPHRASVPTLALGAHLKSTFTLVDGTRAIVGPHLGDLDHLEAIDAFTRTADHFERLFDVTPRRLVHDLHPDFASTRYAHERARRERLERIAVQHHHAHMAACMAEHGLTRRAIGVVFDGFGLGHDGAAWGGEFLVGDCAEATRAAHLDYVPLPGGDAASREPWRMAVAWLLQSGIDPFAQSIASRIGRGSVQTIVQMIERRLNTPNTSSIGRLFDAVAALAGICDRARYEGQGAVALEALARGERAVGEYEFDLIDGDPIRLDARPVIRAVTDDVARGIAATVIARRFHDGLASAVATICARLRDQRAPQRTHATGLGGTPSPSAERGTGGEAFGETGGEAPVLLTGGVFVNAVLLDSTVTRLESAGATVYRHERIPTNDGGISFGQAAVIAARDERAERV